MLKHLIFSFEKSTMVQPFISIIIPVFNASDYLDKCLDSIQNQNFKYFEILIIQRVTNDETIEIIATKNRNLPINIIQTQESGIYKAMNIGCNEAQGNWFIFLGQDDQLADSNTFSYVFNSLKNKNEGIALGSVEIIDKKSWLIPSNYPNKISPLIYLKNTLHHQGIFYHSSTFKNNKYDENLTILADYKLTLELIQSKVKIFYLNTLISKCSGTGISKKFTRSLYLEEKQIKKNLYPFIIYIFISFFISIKQFIKTSISD